MSEPVGNSPRGNIPGNSHKAREEMQAQTEPAREKIDKIIPGTAIVKKKPWYRRAGKGILAEDAGSVGGYIFQNVIVPSLRNLAADTIKGATDRIFYGGSVHAGRGLPSSVLGQPGSIRQKYHGLDDEPRNRQLSKASMARHEFNDIVLPSREEAVMVLNDLIERVERYKVASVTDLYDLVGVTGSYADLKHGWYDLRDADIRHSRGGWLLDLPRPEPLR